LCIDPVYIIGIGSEQPISKIIHFSYRINGIDQNSRY
jgi:hypothetical protein